ncbi:hypothetical protein E2K62_06180, partial [Escherichia coli]
MLISPFDPDAVVTPQHCSAPVAADYKIDKEGQHAFVNFRIQHLGYSWLYGTFKDFDGTFTF